MARAVAFVRQSDRAIQRSVERAGAKQLVLFHHEPTRSDEQLDQLLARAREHSRRTLLAREGDVLSF